MNERVCLPKLVAGVGGCLVGVMVFISDETRLSILVKFLLFVVGVLPFFFEICKLHEISAINGRRKRFLRGSSLRCKEMR